MLNRHLVSRRASLRALGVVACFALAGQAVLAQTYPTRAVKIIVPYSAGGMTDIIGRTFSQKLSTMLGQAVVIDNKPGAGTVVGTVIAAKAPNDGYTLLMVSGSAFTSNPNMNKNLPYDADKDFVAIAPLVSASNLLFVRPDSPVSTLAEFVAAAKKSPKPLAFASYGNGTGTHLMGEMLKLAAGVDLIHVPYGGVAPAVQSVLAGETAIGFDTVFTAIGRVKSGQIKPLAIMQRKRSPLLPGVPTNAEAGFPGIEITAWIGLFAPAGTPPAVVKKLREATRTIQADAEFLEKLAAAGTEPLVLSPDEFAHMIREESESIRRVVQRAKLPIQN